MAKDDKKTDDKNKKKKTDSENTEEKRRFLPDISLSDVRKKTTGAAGDIIKGTISGLLTMFIWDKWKNRGDAETSDDTGDDTELS